MILVFEKILMIAIFIVVTVFVGLYSRKRAQNVGDFVLGGRKVGAWLTAFAYGTSYFSSVVFVGYAGQFGWNFGVSAAWIGIANAVLGSLLAWVVLGKRTRIMTKHLDSSTMPDFFQSRYDSKTIKIVASVIIFIFLVPYSASVYKGLSGLFAMCFGIDFTYCIIGMAVLTGIYVIAGGYVATAINDFIQGIIMIVGISVVVFTVLSGKVVLPRRLRSCPRSLRLRRPALTAPSLRSSAPLRLSFWASPSSQASAPGACRIWSTSFIPSTARNRSKQVQTSQPFSR
jgi:SSS family solute:Na+ symporter